MRPITHRSSLPPSWHPRSALQAHRDRRRRLRRVLPFRWDQRRLWRRRARRERRLTRRPQRGRRRLERRRMWLRLRPRRPRRRRRRPREPGRSRQRLLKCHRLRSPRLTMWNAVAAPGRVRWRTSPRRRAALPTRPSCRRVVAARARARRRRLRVSSGRVVRLTRERSLVLRAPPGRRGATRRLANEDRTRPRRRARARRRWRYPRPPRVPTVHGLPSEARSGRRRALPVRPPPPPRRRPQPLPPRRRLPPPRRRLDERRVAHGPRRRGRPRAPKRASRSGRGGLGCRWGSGMRDRHGGWARPRGSGRWALRPARVRRLAAVQREPFQGCAMGRGAVEPSVRDPGRGVRPLTAARRRRRARSEVFTSA
jgi:hypothetical protein